MLTLAGSALSVLGRSLYLIGLALYLLVMEAILIAMMACVSFPFVYAAFDLLGWEYGARHALLLAVVGVALVGGAIAFSMWLEIRARPMTLAQMLSHGLGDLISQDDYGKLWRIRGATDAEPLIVVEVVNMTPERDGSYAHHFLRVPPTVGTAREAVAWTFGFDNAGDYILAAAS